MRNLLFFIGLIFFACSGPPRSIDLADEKNDFPASKAVHFKPPVPVKVSWTLSPDKAKPRINKASFDAFKNPVFDIEPWHAVSLPLDSTLVKLNQLPFVPLSLKTLPKKKIKPEIIILGKPLKVKAGYPVVENQFPKGMMELGQDQGLPGTTPVSLMQDKSGRLWLGTDNGLCVYDGEFIYTWFKRSGMSYDTKFSLLSDKKGHIWAVGNGVDEIIPDEGIVRHFGKKQGLSNNNSTDIIEDSKGRICISSRDGVDIYDPADSTLIYIGTQNGLSTGNVNRTIEDRDGKYWFATNCGGVDIYDPATEKLYLLNHKQNLSNNDIRSILEDKNGNIWMGGWNGGVDMYNYKQGVFYHLREKHGLSFRYIPALLQDHNGIIWISCLGRGVDCYDPATRKISHVYGKEGIVKSTVTCIFEDRNNCVWLGCEGAGVIKYDPSNGDITNFDPQWRRAKNPIQALHCDSEGAYWISSAGQGVDIFDPKKHSLSGFNMGNDWTNGWINEIKEDDKGKIYLSSDYRLTVYDKKTGNLTSWSRSEGMIHDGIKSFVLSGEDVILGTNAGIGKYDHLTSGFMHLQSQSEPWKNAVSCMTKDSSGKIWVGTYKAGLFLFDPMASELTHFSKENGFTNNTIYSIATDKKGRVWVGTGGSGLLKIDLQKNTVTKITPEEGLAEMTVTSLVSFGNKIYAGTVKGLSVIEDEDGKINIQNSGKLQGFRTSDFNSNVKLVSPQGTIWWGIGDMLTIYKPLVRQQAAGKTAITAIDVMGKELEFNASENFISKLSLADTIWPGSKDTFYFKNNVRKDTVNSRGEITEWKALTGPYHIPDELQLPYYSDHITFHFTGNHLSNPDKTRYRYILEGLEQKWNPAEAEAFADYRNLPPGKYVFKVSSSNFGGPWSEPTKIKLIISPPWWKTRAAYAFYCLLIIGAGFAYNRINTARLRKRQKELEAVVDERTKEVVLQKNEIELQKQTVEEKQKEIVDSINYAKRIQYALLAHQKVLKKHFSDHFVLFQPKDIVSGDFYWATKKVLSSKLKAENEAELQTAGFDRQTNDELFYLAVCDSTGHGVPGAFMSLLNINFLNEAINEKSILEPHEILNYVRERLVKSISRDGGQDGMDGILLCIETKTLSNSDESIITKITYAAGNNNPVLFSNGVISELPANKMPIGKGEREEAFTLHTVNAIKGDILYLYTDGYADQFGGPKGKKFKYKKLNDLLLHNAAETMEKQNEILLKAINNWKGDLEQIDDICVIGIKI